MTSKADQRSRGRARESAASTAQSNGRNRGRPLTAKGLQVVAQDQDLEVLGAIALRKVAGPGGETAQNGEDRQLSTAEGGTDALVRGRIGVLG